MSCFIFYTKLELLNSRDYTNEMDFLGEMARELYSYIISGQMNKISGCVFGAKDHYNNDVTIDRLLGNTFIDFSPKLCAIYLPSKEILTRTKFGWFSRLSQEQLKTLGEQNSLETLPIVKDQLPNEIAKRALNAATLKGSDIIIFVCNFQFVSLTIYVCNFWYIYFLLPINILLT